MGETSRRIGYLTAGLLLLFVLLAGRLGQMQLVEGAYYQKLAAGNLIRLEPILAPRGAIVSRTGKTLVTTQPAFNAYYFRMGKPPSAAELNSLAAILGTPVSRIETVLAKYRAFPYQQIPLKLNLSPREHTLLAENQRSLPGVTVQVQAMRSYPLGNVGAQVFGYVNQISPSELRLWKGRGYQMGEVVGQAGLEYQYQKYLQGKNGGQQVEVNSLGQPTVVLGKVAPVPGDKLVTTLSASLEETAAGALQQAMRDNRLKFGARVAPGKAGSMVVINVHTGAVLAMVSLPSYNPNWFAQGITAKEYAGLMSPAADLPFLNRAIQTALPPGSVFKMISAVTGLMTGAITPSTIIYGAPRYWLPPYPKNWTYPYATGPNDLAKAIAQSCDVYFYELGRRVGINNIAKVAHMFGFGAKTGVDLPGENPGFVPTVKWEKAQNNGALYPALSYYAAIGQGANEQTVIQLADYVAAVAADGVRYRPYLVSKIVAPDGKTVKQFSPQVAAKIKLSAADWAAIHLGMQGVTHAGSIPGPGGTAGTTFVGFPMKVAGKTGTAQEYGKAYYQTYFVSFAPYKHPQIAVAAYIDGAGEGADVAPAVRVIYDQYFHLHDKFNIDNFFGVKP